MSVCVHGCVSVFMRADAVCACAEQSMMELECAIVCGSESSLAERLTLPELVSCLKLVCMWLFEEQ